MTPTRSRRPSPAAHAFQRTAYLALAGALLALGARAQSETFPERDTIVEPTPDDPRIASSVRDVEGAASPETPPAPDLTRLGSAGPGRLYHGTEEDGSPAALAATYKARFGPEGAVYTPFLGSEAPRNHPIAFRVASASIGGVPIPFDADARAARVADAILYQRGGLVEVYDLGPDAIEQRFVFDTLPGTGELVVRVSAVTDLVVREVEDGFHFESDLGAVRYGRATALDADGRSVSAPTTLTEGGIEIRVPGDFVAEARLPLVIDPWISSFSIENSSILASNPDCSYDMSTGRWLVVHQEVWSQTDHDVVWRTIGALSAQTLGGGYVDGNLSDYWANPASANNNATDRFLVVAQVGVPSSTGGASYRRILARTLAASNGALGVTVDLSLDPNSDHVEPDVGGDPYPGLAYFLSAWVKRPPTGASYPPSSVQRALLSTSAAIVVGPQLVGPGSPFSRPSVSESNDASAWNVVWDPDNDEFLYQFTGARVGWQGSLIQGPFGVPASALHSSRPVASTCLNGTQTWVVVYETSDPAGQGDVGMTLMDGSTYLDLGNLSEQESRTGAIDRMQHQGVPSVDTDGRSFAVAYWNNSPISIRTATVGVVANRLRLSESVHVASTTYPANFRSTEVASTEGSGLPWRLELVVHDSGVTGGAPFATGDVGGALYDHALYTPYCFPGYDGVATCPCGNPPSQHGRGCNNPANTGGARLSATGFCSVGGDSMGLVGEFLPLNQTVTFYQGTSALTSAVFHGQGTSCVGGSIVSLYTKGSIPLGGAAYATAPNPGDPRIAARSAALGYPIFAGQTRQYFASYGPVGTSGGGHGSSACQTGLAANATQSLQATWIP